MDTIRNTIIIVTGISGILFAISNFSVNFLSWVIKKQYDICITEYNKSEVALTCITSIIYIGSVVVSVLIGKQSGKGNSSLASSIIFIMWGVSLLFVAISINIFSYRIKCFANFFKNDKNKRMGKWINILCYLAIIIGILGIILTGVTVSKEYKGFNKTSLEVTNNYRTKYLSTINSNFILNENDKLILKINNKIITGNKIEKGSFEDDCIVFCYNDKNVFYERIDNFEIKDRDVVTLYVNGEKILNEQYMDSVYIDYFYAVVFMLAFIILYINALVAYGIKGFNNKLTNVKKYKIYLSDKTLLGYLLFENRDYYLFVNSDSEKQYINKKEVKFIEELKGYNIKNYKK